MPFPILFRTTVTTVLHYRADCDQLKIDRVEIDEDEAGKLQAFQRISNVVLYISFHKHMQTFYCLNSCLCLKNKHAQKETVSGFVREALVNSLSYGVKLRVGIN